MCEISPNRHLQVSGTRDQNMLRQSDTWNTKMHRSDMGSIWQTKPYSIGSSIPICLNRKVYDQCVLSVKIYGAEAETHGCANKLRTTQRAMERAKLGVRLQDRYRRSGVQDVIKRIATLKWNWAWTVDKTNHGVEIQKL